MNDLLLLSMMLVGLNAELVESTEIKRTIIIRKVNGKTEIIGLDDKVDNDTLKVCEEGETKLVVHVDQEGDNNPPQENEPD